MSDDREHHQELGVCGRGHPDWEWGEADWPQTLEGLRTMDVIPIAVLPVCARCGGRHEDLEARRMERPMVFEGYPGGPVTHFALCPETGAPIVLDWHANREKKP